MPLIHPGPRSLAEDVLAEDLSSEKEARESVCAWTQLMPAKRVFVREKKKKLLSAGHIYELCIGPTPQFGVEFMP